jgi:hypothetical protein
MRAKTAFGRFDAQWRLSPIDTPSETIIPPVAFSTNDNEQTSLIFVAEHEAV